MENISLCNVHLTFGGGGTAEDAARRDLPQIAGEYFMMGPMPAYGLYARNVHGITMQNMRFQVSTPDLRPALIFDHVEDAAINGFSVQANPQAESVVRFIDSRQTLFTAVRVLGQVRYFCSLRVQKMKPSSSSMAKASTNLIFARCGDPTTPALPASATPCTCTSTFGRVSMWPSAA